MKALFRAMRHKRFGNKSYWKPLEIIISTFTKRNSRKKSILSLGEDKLTISVIDGDKYAEITFAGEALRELIFELSQMHSFYVPDNRAKLCECGIESDTVSPKSNVCNQCGCTKLDLSIEIIKASNEVIEQSG